MTESGVFLPLLIVIGSATAAATGFHYLRLPPIPGYILAGFVVGPYGLAWVGSLPGAETITEIGVVLLMFTIGMELSLHHLRDLRRSLLALGPIQVVATLLVIAALGRYLGSLTWNQGLIVGALIAVSSTAIGIKLLEEAGEIQSALRSAVLGTLIFQDIATIPMLIAVPILSGATTGESAVIGSILLGVGFLGGLAAVSRIVLPRLLEYVARTGNREIFFSSIVLICFGVAFLAVEVGLSLSLGAFVAGLVIADSPFGHRATAEFAPLRDPVLGLFFTAVGMLLDPRFVADHWLSILPISAALLLIKAGILYVTLRALRYHHSVSLLATAAMFGLGEFSLVLAHAGSSAHLFTPAHTQYILAVILISMVATPFLFRAAAATRLAPGLAGLMGRATEPQPGPGRRASILPAPADAQDLQGHTLIIGFGITGQDLGDALRSLGILYTAIDVDYDRVKEATGAGATVIWGDAARQEVLEQAGIHAARQVVVAVSSPGMIPGILSAIRVLRPEVPIVLRVQYLRQAAQLQLSGPVDVVVQELETAIEILIKALNLYGVPPDQVRKLLTPLRQRLDRPDVLLHRAMRHALGLPGWEDQVLLRPLKIPPGSPAIERTLAELNLRQRTGALIVAVFRETLGAIVPHASFRLVEGDIVQIIGSRETLQATLAFLTGEAEA